MSNLKRMSRYLSKYKISLFFVFLFSVLSTIFTVLAPFVAGEITTSLFDSIKTSVFDWDRINLLVVILFSLYVISNIFTFAQNFLLANVSARVVKKIREDVDYKIHKMKLSYYDKYQNGEILSIVTNDIDTISEMLGNNITQLITQLVTAAGIFFIMLKISLSLTLISVVTLVISLVSVTFIMKKSGKYFGMQQQLLGKTNGFIEEMYNGHFIVQSFNHRKKAEAEFERLNKDLYEAAKQSEAISSLSNPSMMFLTNLSYIFTAFYGAFLVLSGSITVGNVQAMLQYARQFSQPFSTIASISASFSSFLAGSKRVFDLIDSDEEVVEVAQDTQIPIVKGNVEFKSVNFGYSKNKNIMNDVNLSVSAGEKVAIAGPTGAGKSTLINLLMRFYDVDGGQILLDGVDTRKITRENLRDNFGMVLQDTWLFEGSIMENLSYGQKTLDEKRVVEVAKLLGVDDFIRTLPNGYNMQLTHGGENISQGERQLLTIVRALVSNPKIIILDEATSNVDTRTEFVIQRAMKELVSNRTSFVIAHRLSTIKDADKILYMEDGSIKEMGTHLELMAQNGKYKALYDSQFL